MYPACRGKGGDRFGHLQSVGPVVRLTRTIYEVSKQIFALERVFQVPRQNSRQAFPPGARTPPPGPRNSSGPDSWRRFYLYKEGKACELTPTP